MGKNMEHICISLIQQREKVLEVFWLICLIIKFVAVIKNTSLNGVNFIFCMNFQKRKKH